MRVPLLDPPNPDNGPQRTGIDQGQATQKYRDDLRTHGNTVQSAWTVDSTCPSTRIEWGLGSLSSSPSCASSMLMPLEVLQIDGNDVKAEMQRCGSNNQVFEGDGDPLARLFAFDAPGKLGNRH